MSVALQTTDLGRRYRETWALRHCSVRLAAGQLPDVPVQRDVGVLEPLQCDVGVEANAVESATKFQKLSDPKTWIERVILGHEPDAGQHFLLAAP